MFDYFLKTLLNSKQYINHLRKKGCKIGSDVQLYSPINSIVIDYTRPWMINIGNHVRITKGVTILTHDYSWSVIKGMSGEILGAAKEVTIGNNVFIGINSTIVGGVTIGNNVIIGANSLVSKNIPSGVVAAGNPAKIICTIDEYRQKRAEKQLSEAVDLTIKYYETHQQWPSKKILREFIWIFEDRTTDIENDQVFKEIGNLGENFNKTKKAFYKSRGKFKSFDDFIIYCKNEYKKQNKESVTSSQKRRRK